MDIFFPSCNFTKASPEAAKRIRAYMKERMPVAGCCRTDKTVRMKADTAVYFCQACREMLEAQTPMRMQSLWEYLAADESFPWPDYGGVCMNLQDCWRDRNHPLVRDAVRVCLRKMNIRAAVIEPAESRSDFCGNLHAEPKSPALLEQMALYPGKRIYELPDELEKAIMREQAAKVTEHWVVGYCNRCIQGLRTGGANAVHLLDLLVGAAAI